MATTVSPTHCIVLNGVGQHDPGEGTMPKPLSGTMVINPPLTFSPHAAVNMHLTGLLVAPETYLYPFPRSACRIGINIVTDDPDEEQLGWREVELASEGALLVGPEGEKRFDVVPMWDLGFKMNDPSEVRLGMGLRKVQGVEDAPYVHDEQFVATLQVILQQTLVKYCEDYYQHLAATDIVLRYGDDPETRTKRSRNVLGIFKPQYDVTSLSIRFTNLTVANAFGACTLDPIVSYKPNPREAVAWFPNPCSLPPTMYLQIDGANATGSVSIANIETAQYNTRPQDNIVGIVPIGETDTVPWYTTFWNQPMPLETTSQLNQLSVIFTTEARTIVATNRPLSVVLAVTETAKGQGSVVLNPMQKPQQWMY